MTTCQHTWDTINGLIECTRCATRVNAVDYAALEAERDTAEAAVLFWQEVADGYWDERDEALRKLKLERAISRAWEEGAGDWRDMAIRRKTERDALRAELAQAQATVEVLVEALCDYGAHYSHCTMAQSLTGTCDCGLWELQSGDTLPATAQAQATRRAAEREALEIIWRLHSAKALEAKMHASDLSFWKHCLDAWKKAKPEDKDDWTAFVARVALDAAPEEA